MSFTTWKVKPHNHVGQNCPSKDWCKLVAAFLFHIIIVFFSMWYGKHVPILYTVICQWSLRTQDECVCSQLLIVISPSVRNMFLKERECMLWMHENDMIMWRRVASLWMNEGKISQRQLYPFTVHRFYPMWAVIYVLLCILTRMREVDMYACCLDI